MTFTKTVEDYFYPIDYEYNPEEVARSVPDYHVSIKQRWPFFIKRALDTHFGLISYKEKDQIIRNFVSTILGVYERNIDYSVTAFFRFHYCKKYNLPENLFDIDDEDTKNFFSKYYGLCYVDSLYYQLGTLYIFTDLELKKYNETRPTV